MKTIGILPFRKYEGKPQTGSSTFRCDWLLRYWDEAEEFRYGQPYEVIIYQKAYWPEHARLFKGVKILDIADPDWLHWGYRTKEMIDEVDAVTCSSQALADAVQAFTDKPVVFIPDRVDLKMFRPKKEHVRAAKRAAWFGYSANFCMLDQVVPHLSMHGLELIVISNDEYRVPVGYENVKCESFRFDWKSIERKLTMADFVLNPQSLSGRWRYKSENKTVLAWALGLPVAKSPDDIKRFLNPEVRKREVDERWKEVKKDYDIILSVGQFKALIVKIKEKKNV